MVLKPRSRFDKEADYLPLFPCLLSLAIIECRLTKCAFQGAHVNIFRKIHWPHFILKRQNWRREQTLASSPRRISCWNGLKPSKQGKYTLDRFTGLAWKDELEVIKMPAGELPRIGAGMDQYGSAGSGQTETGAGLPFRGQTTINERRHKCSRLMLTNKTTFMGACRRTAEAVSRRTEKCIPAMFSKKLH